jgi:hypothetical protein
MPEFLYGIEVKPGPLHRRFTGGGDPTTRGKKAKTKTRRKTKRRST